jgi:hypothetical protein
MGRAAATSRDVGRSDDKRARDRRDISYVEGESVARSFAS